MLLLKNAQTETHIVQSNDMTMVKQHQSQTNKLINYFYSSNNTDANKSKSNAMTQRIHEKFGNMFNGIGCFKGTFSLQLKARQQAISSASKVHGI